MPTPTTSGRPWPSADAAFVNLARTGLGRIFVGLGLLLFFTGCAAAGAIWPERFLTEDGEGGARNIAAVIAVLFGALSVVMLFGLARTLRTHGPAVDRSGLWFLTGGRAEVAPWPQILAIGGSWVPARGGARGLGGMAVDAMLTDKGRRFFAVEVFLYDPGAVAGQRTFDRQLHRTRNERPPRAGLPGARLRFTFRTIRHYRAFAARLNRWAPQLWIGEYQR
ncbi:hypothetical protein F4561_003507 [Lipingzhangella halophila]|uniref:Uncharacterized protein n=1 Tax=Lipingzhangella halophila TaxID=1783352 RepID=A0A7W7RIN0_9ACTN|nr:hypothetical protein [Lipingzhangella halophila]MBB4932687.1 hypothetical protein [Lipingzhangella halophila]